MSSTRVVLPTKKISEIENPDTYQEVVADLLNVPKYGNETDVREDFIVPLLKALGYSNSGKNKIERGVYLTVPDLIVGTKKKSLEQYSPDYVVNVNEIRKWVIDAKSPTESILDEKHISQAYSYSIHREVNVPIFVICNGEEFAIFKTQDQTYKPFTVFKRYELDYRWQELYEMFSVEAFKTRLKVIPGADFKAIKTEDKPSETKWEKPIEKVITPRKQASCIHKGTHPYFTKRAWNVVREYVDHFTNKGEVVLDCYGGAGVTAIESVLTERRAIHVDINPIANFMTEALALPVALDKLNETYQKIEKKFSEGVSKIYSESAPRPKHWFPRNVKLPKDADVERLQDYFSPRQLASMSLLLNLVNKIGDADLKKVFRLIFSSTLVKCNISFHNTGRDTNNGGGDAGFLKYYRYQIPKKRFKEVDPLKVFKEKYLAMFKAKKEILKYAPDHTKFNSRLTVIQGSATDLSSIPDGSIDYVFTDPPYGSKISYLDCSILWNSWLQLDVPKDSLEKEVISGGSLKKTDERYVELLQLSLNEIYRVLKPDRWFSIVFASENPKFWHAIRDYCIRLGFEHVNTICQPSDRKTVKKNQNPLTVFKGEMVLNFRKRKSRRHVVGVASKLPPKQYVLNSAELTIVTNEGRASIDQIMQDLIPKLWESGLLGAVSNEIDDINEILKESFSVDKKGFWRIKEKSKIGCHIPLESRMKFYLLSCLNRAKNESKKLTIDDIIMEVMPYLRNGITPSNQAIIEELRKIAYSKDGEHWQVRVSGEFDF